MADDFRHADMQMSYEEATFRDGCLSLRMAVLERQRAQCSPGPKYSIPDGLGKQTLSTIPTTPIISFGHAGTEETGRPVERAGARDVPGPQYQLDNITFGRQVESRRRTAPTPSFGTSQRAPLLVGDHCSPGPGSCLPRPLDPRAGASFGIAPWRNRPVPGSDTPAPDHYTVGDSMGKQVLSTCASNNPFSFGGKNVERGLAKRNCENEPGPGSYDTSGASGARNIKFGGAPQRPPDRKPEDGPGPSQYQLTAALGRQVSSRYKTQAIVGFGKPRPMTSGRLPDSATTPAPGQYKVDNDEAAFGFRINSKERSVPGVKFAQGPARHSDMLRSQGPGVQTYDPEKINRAVLLQSNKRSVPGVKFGTGPQRYDAATREAKPGPQAYDPASIRKGIDFTKRKHTHAISFGTGPQRVRERGHEGPGPSQYGVPSAMGRQVSSLYKTASTPTFGSGPQRYNDVKVGTSPGPQTYDPDIRSSKPSRTKNIKFGSGPQRRDGRSSDAPDGPNNAQLPAALGRQASSRYRSQPAFTFGAR